MSALGRKRTFKHGLAAEGSGCPLGKEADESQHLQRKLLLGGLLLGMRQLGFDKHRQGYTDFVPKRPVPLHFMHIGFVILFAPNCGLRLERTACPVPPQAGHFCGFVLGFDFLKIICRPV